VGRSREKVEDSEGTLRCLLASSEVGLGGRGAGVLRLPSRKGPADL
jgi:hypothetical protein